MLDSRKWLPSMMSGSAVVVIVRGIASGCFALVVEHCLYELARLIMDVRSRSDVSRLNVVFQRSILVAIKNLFRVVFAQLLY